jgi:hypothetical protein
MITSSLPMLSLCTNCISITITRMLMLFKLIHPIVHINQILISQNPATQNTTVQLNKATSFRLI